MDKLFTYATPHNGIDVLGMNVPSWLGLADINNFDCDKRMKSYLDLEAAFKKHKRVDLVPESRFPSRRIFTLVGTNRTTTKPPPACRAPLWAMAAMVWSRSTTPRSTASKMTAA